MKRIIIALFLAGILAGFTGSITAQSAQEKAAQLIAVLKSDAGQKEKAEACRELGVLGGKEAVAPLAELLKDAKLAHMARVGLEPIPDPAVDEALRQALTSLKGKLLVGVIGSIGVRKDAAAVEPLAKLLSDSDADVARAAARALGKIATPPAAKALQKALPGVSDQNQLAFCEGLFRCAEGLGARGERALAKEIYDQLRKVKGPHQVRAGALRGAIALQGKEGVGLIRESLKNEDYILFAAAVRAAQESKEAEVTQALAGSLPGLAEDRQVVVLQTLGQRGDAKALEALSNAAKGGAKPVRLAAIRAIGQLGQSSAAGALLRLFNDPDREIGQAAQETFASLSGPEVDSAVVAMLKSDSSATQLLALDLIARRRMIGCIPDVLKAASGPDAKLRPAAARKLGELGGPGELDNLLKLLAQYSAPADLDAAEEALGAVCAKAEPEQSSAKLIQALANAKPEQKTILLQLLSGVGGAQALGAVRQAVSDSNSEVHAAAIRALGSWKTPDAAPELLNLAKNAPNPTEKLLCLRGYLSLAGNPDLPVEQRVRMCQEAGGLVQRPEEKKLLLGTMGSVNSPEAVALIVPHLADEAVKQEACAALVAVSERLLQRQNAAKVAPRLIEPLQKAAAAAGNTDLGNKAKALAQQAQAKAGK